MALTSYYSKLFVNRSERAVFNYPSWLLNEITSRAIDATDESVTDVRMAKVFDNEVDTPKVYGILATRFAGFVSNRYEFFFDYHKRNDFFTEKVVKEIEGKKVKLIPIAKSKDEYLVMDWNDKIYSVSRTKNAEAVKLGDIETVIGIETAKRPLEVAEIQVFAKAIPVAFVLGHELGLGNLIETIGAKVRRVGKRERYDVAPNEFTIAFNDEVLIVNRDDKLASLILGSLNRYQRDIKKYSVYMFDKKEVYQAILEANSLGARYPREFDLMFKMWVDSITKEILVDMKEPTDLVSLIIRACELLMTEQHPSVVDNAYMRDKGYERMAGMMYTELVKAIRVYQARPANATATVDLNPNVVWNNIAADPTTTVVEESNPIHNLKEKEVIIYRGAGGRSSRSMTAETRAFHKNSMGVISEASTDNADVGTVIYTTADPNYTSLRGLVRPLNKTEGNAAKLASTSMLLAVGGENDSGKRAGYTAIQNSQTIHCEGYTPMPARTGYERVLAHRTDDLFAKIADQDGVVEKVTDSVLTVRYKDDSTASFEIGRRFGKMAGDIVPHSVVTELKEGSKFKKGAVIVYNKDYFTIDKLDPSQVIYKPGVLAKVAIMESVETFEDSCAISAEFANKLKTNATHIRTIKVSFEQEIRNLLEVGTAVDVESILCTIQNPGEGNKELFDEKALATLKVISSLTPKAKATGTIERIEVLYAGELEDMSHSIRALTERSDRELSRKYKQMGKPAVNGQIEAGYRVDGIPMDMDTVAIRVYITGPMPMGVGDKCVYGNQMKSIVGRVMTGDNTTEDGQKLDATFSYNGFIKRVVHSPELMGTLNSLLLRVGERVIAAYRGK